MAALLLGCVRTALAGGVPSFECAALAPPGKRLAQFAVVAGDWNGDGRRDLAVSYLSDNSLGLFLNRGGRRFELSATVRTGEVPRHIGAGDADGDGKIDFAVANAGSNDVTLILGDGKGGHSRTLPLQTGVSPFDAQFADFDGDGKLDMVSVNESNPGYPMKGQVQVLFGGKGTGLVTDIGGGIFSEMVELKAGQHPARLAIADLDGRHGLDLAVVNWESATISVFLHEGGRRFGPEREVATGGALTYAIFGGDLDGDGAVDLATSEVGLEGGPVARVFRGDGKGDFTPAGVYPVGRGARHIAGGDLDGDGHLDLITANTSAESVSVLMNDGKGNFTPAAHLRVGIGPRTVMAADLDGDGMVDLAAANGRTMAVSLLWQTKGKARPCPENRPEKPSVSKH